MWIIHAGLRLPNAFFIGSGGILSMWPKTADAKAFNGYANEVASLYRGLNLRENFKRV